VGGRADRRAKVICLGQEEAILTGSLSVTLAVLTGMLSIRTKVI
jgi:hypothetical protein